MTDAMHDFSVGAQAARCQNGPVPRSMYSTCPAARATGQAGTYFPARAPSRCQVETTVSGLSEMDVMP